MRPWGPTVCVYTHVVDVNLEVMSRGFVGQKFGWETMRWVLDKEDVGSGRLMFL